ncbi:MAG: COX15/CtaA family protein [Acidimicrobiales bacterium]
MPLGHGPSRRDPAVRWLRVLAISTLLATYSLVVLGSTVRVTGSGMGCPGWPLCYGQVGPIDHFHSLLEQSHRYLAALVTVLIIGVALLAWRAGDRARYVRGPALAAVGTIALQIVLGAVTVVTHNAPATVAAHLAVGLLFLGVVTVVVVASFVRPEHSWSWRQAHGRLALVAVVGLFFVLVSGSLVVDGGAQAACRSWPVCSGTRASGGLVALQLTHRSVVLLGGTLVFAYLVTVHRRRAGHPGLRVLALAGLALLAAQVAIGAVDALLGAPEALADLHLATAGALWTVVVAVVATAGTNTRIESGRFAALA